MSTDSSRISTPKSATPEREPMLKERQEDLRKREEKKGKLAKSITSSPLHLFTSSSPLPTPSAIRVVIIGGGFAGLAAGVELSERGVEVLLLERRNHLGGRAYSFTDTRTGDIVDNGQHLFMGCYAQTIAFLDKLGCLDRLTFQERPRVDFLDTDRRYDSFDCPDLPAPLHVLGGLLLMRGLTFGDKLRALNLGRALRGKVKENGAQTVAEWLATLRQSPRIRERFWYPMAIATLNEDPDIASARLLGVVLREAFGGGRPAGVDASAMGIANVGLSELYTDAAQGFIEARGGEVRCLAQVSRLLIEDGRVIGVELKGGERVEADAVISAVPPNVLAQIVEQTRGVAASSSVSSSTTSLATGSSSDKDLPKEFADLVKLKSSPIVSINLWFDRQLTDRQFLGLIGTRLQWLFNKDAILRAGKETNQLALVISAAHGFTAWTKQQLVEMALAELGELIPESRSARLLHSVIVKERDATLSHTLAADALRPGAKTSIQNFFLAGDWTDTGLPATIESAVLSGRRAAALIEG